MCMPTIHYSKLMSSVDLSSSYPQCLHLTCRTRNTSNMKDIVQNNNRANNQCSSSLECMRLISMATIIMDTIYSLTM